MNRRQFLASPFPFLAVVPGAFPSIIRVHVIHDTESRIAVRRMIHFRDTIWPEACNDLAKTGTSVRVTSGRGRIIRPPNRTPILEGLRDGHINMFLSASVPMHWDRCRALKGVAFDYGGNHVCIIALNNAHAHWIPFFATNTCLHELLHVLLGHTGRAKPQGVGADMLELRVDAIATQLHYSLGNRQLA